MLSKAHQRKMFLGGYVYGNQNQNNQPSSARGSIWGSAYSPFRNTNMPLQDITMSTTLPFVNGTNSKSSGKNSPVSGVVEGVPGMASAGVGRTMKEYEDQLGALKKENFNLKLRIYFLEERMGITSADEDAIKKNIELKVEVESLRKELAEKQELLSQAAKAFELIEEQKEVSSRNQTQYEQSLEKERERILQLEKELEEYRERATTDASIFYKEAFGVTPEKALENEKLHQMEELVESLEAEVRQLSDSLEKEREWAQELESERDEYRDRFEAAIQMRENLVTERLRDIDELREQVRELEDQIFKKDTIIQQYKSEISEKDRAIKEKNTLLEEKCRAYEDICSVSDRRKKQIDHLKTSVKARDDALTDLNNKHRTLLSQFENGYTKRSPVSSPSTVNPFIESMSPRMAQKLTCLQGSANNDSAAFEREANKERLIKVKSPTIMMASTDEKETKELAKELQEKELELKRQEEEKKQLILKLCNVQKQVEVTDQKFKKMEGEHQKAVKMIQGFMERQQQLEDRIARKERKIEELEAELNRSSGYEDVKARRRDGSARKDYGVEITENPERDDNSNQQRFEEMEAKINDLRDQIETIKEEKHRLEKQIQVESEELQERLNDKDQRIEFLEIEKNTMKEELQDKITELDKLKQATVEIPTNEFFESSEYKKLIQELDLRNAEIVEKNQKIEQLSKELQVKTHNLQKLVNTELWSKNKEIAKLHNHMTANNQLDRSRSKTDIPQESASTHFATLIKELSDIGIKVSFTNEIIQLNYVNGNESIDVKTMTEYIQTLVEKKNELEKEVDYLNWLKLVTKPDIKAEIDECENESERTRKYCELLRAHLKDLVKLMKDILKNANHLDTINSNHNQIVLDVLLSSNIFSDEFAQVLEEMTKHVVIFGNNKNAIENNEKTDNAVKKSYSENILDLPKNHTTTQSDSEAFSEPDRIVSMARIGLQETQHKSINRSRFSKHTKTFSDSEDSMDYIPYHKTYQDDLHDLDANNHIQELKETNNLLYSELSALRNDLNTKISYDIVFDEKLVPLIVKLEKSQKVCERLQSSLDKRIHECHALRKESKQNSIRKAQLEKKIVEVESMVAEMSKQKSELLQYKENTEKKTAEMLMVLKKENERLRSKIRTMEEDSETAKAKISALTKELDHLTLLHSQILVENTKLTNEKLRLEQEVRKTDNRYDVSVRLLQDKFNKEISDLNQINDSHRARVEELEATNKELRRHVAVCEASDSAPSSSGVSSIPTDSTLKQACDEIIQEYQNYNASQYWHPINYQTLGGRSKSSCSPDLGIESDATINTIRPLQDTLKITESMTNLLSDEDNGNRNAAAREVDSDSPLPIEGLDEIETLKQENETLKRRLMKTRRALEDTFQHLSTSNKNKKNVEKAITKQLMITKSILKKTRTYDEPFEN